MRMYLGSRSPLWFNILTGCVQLDLLCGETLPACMHACLCGCPPARLPARLPACPAAAAIMLAMSAMPAHPRQAALRQLGRCWHLVKVLGT